MLKMSKALLCVLFFHITVIIVCHSQETLHCIPRFYSGDSQVCVCNSTYCDTAAKVSSPPPNFIDVYESSRSGSRFMKNRLKFGNVSSENDSNEVITIDETSKFQKILGFGGAWTDSTVMNINDLPEEMAKRLIQDYYADDGLEYSIGRVPMAGTDFSIRKYSYCDVPGDFALTNFKLADEDTKLKIPSIRYSLSVSKQPVYLFASPWICPGWMKTNNDSFGLGTLKGTPGGKYYQTWANYFVKFLQAYESHNLTFWGVTAQNEPINGYVPFQYFPNIGFTPELQRDFISENLGPTLQKAGYGVDKLKLMILDDQRFFLPKFAQVVLSDKRASQYVSGIAFHWYYNQFAPAELLDKTRDQFPDKFLLASEACEGSMPWQEKLILGSWERAENYAQDIIEDLLHWSIGWVDWNLALNLQGGPTLISNFVDAPIIVNATAKEYYKQPMFYALMHFTKFIPSGSTRIGFTKNGSKLQTLVVKSPENAIVLVVLNRHMDSVPLKIVDPNTGTVTVTVSPHSIQTYIWNSKI